MQISCHLIQDAAVRLGSESRSPLFVRAALSRHEIAVYQAI